MINANKNVYDQYKVDTVFEESRNNSNSRCSSNKNRDFNLIGLDSNHPSPKANQDYINKAKIIKQRTMTVNSVAK